MSMNVLRKIAELAKAGAIIGGHKPQHPYSLADSQEEFDKLVDEIWSRTCQKVTAEVPMSNVLADAGIVADVQIPEDGLKFLHRTMPYAEIYWINRPAKNNQTLELTFRVAGLKPQVWHPETGVVEDVTYTCNGTNTTVELNFVPDDAFFVVFCGAGKKQVVVPAKNQETLLTVATPWLVKFQEKRGAPAEATFDSLISLSENADSGIKYFSGTSTYCNHIRVDAIDGNAHYLLSLGKVKNLAEVFVNGKSAGIVWKEPFQMDVTGLLRQGDNQLEIQVTNLWVNRLIGDVQPDCKERVTYTDARYYLPDAPLEESGLIGPVSLIKIKIP
jgi:hypothetical protein